MSSCHLSMYYSNFHHQQGATAAAVVHLSGRRLGEGRVAENTHIIRIVVVVFVGPATLVPSAGERTSAD